MAPMELTVKNYKTLLSPDLLKKTQRCLIRECDEISSGTFESYVDELDKSFDVRITIDKQKITSHQCDCLESAPFCHHKAALLSTIVEGKRPAQKIAKSKKVDPMLEALERVDLESLKDWVLKVTKKNKDLTVAFLHEFSANPSGYTPQEIVALTNDAVKAVINKKMKADATEVKKIVELWSDLHTSSLDSYRAEPTNENYFLLLQSIIETCSFYEERLYTNSKRITGYLTKITDELSAILGIIKDLDAWKKSLGYFIAEIFLPDYGLRRTYLDLIISLFNTSTMDRRTEIVGLMATLYEDKKSASVQDRNDILKFLFKLATANHVFSKYKHLFSPIRHEPSYNLNLIDLLIVEGDLKSAEAHCLAQIKANTREDYDFQYLFRLKNIYKSTAEDGKLAGILQALLIHAPDFLDYQFVLLHRPADTDLKRWRNRVLARARQMADYDIDASDFSLALMDLEKNYMGLIEYLDNKVTYLQILPYATILISLHPESFIDKLINRMDCPPDDELLNQAPDILNQSLEELYLILLNHYEPEQIKLMAKKRTSLYRGWSNIFVKYLSTKFAL